MTQTLQEALLKAGLISEDKLKKAEADKKAAQRAARMGQRPQAPQPPRKAAAPAPRNEARPSQPPKTPPARPQADRYTRPPAPRPEVREKKSPGFVEGKHLHHIRTNCDACGRSSPDVEYYEHKNRSLDKYWLCVRCADDNNILDDFRQTVQSSHAIKGVFRRNYGPTKFFAKK